MIVSWILLCLRVLFGLSLAAFCAYSLISLWAARKWHRSRPALDPDWTPPVTIFKPVRGVDAEAYENFAGFCRQDYPPDRVQILFGALDPADPALELAHRLQAEFPDRDIGIVSGSPEAIQGANRKVCNLLAMLPAAKHDLFVLCDSDMRVQPDYLRRLVAPFQDSHHPQQGCATRSPNSLITRISARGTEARREEEETHLAPGPSPIRRGETSFLPSAEEEGIEDTSSPHHLITSSKKVGLVTCPYRGHRALSFAARLEALGIGADFIPSVMVSRALEGVSFALGSTIALPRAVLEEIGGFEPLRDELADDFRLGNGVFKAGYEVVLSDYVIDDVLGQEQFGPMWARRLRWARTVRVCRPAGYAGAAITHGVPLALLFLMASGFAVYGWIVFVAILWFRLLTALWITRRYTGDPNIIRDLPLLPVSDLLSFSLYVLSYCGNRITWRGEQFRLDPGGKIVRIPNR